MKIWLIGMMGSGKTTAGEIAASNLGVRFFDTDRIAEERTGTSIARLWADRGENAFRDVERAIVRSLVDADGIVATGGGVVLDEGNRRLLVESGTVVWLDATPMELRARIDGSAGRPLLTAASGTTEEILESKLRERGAIYESVAEYRIDTDHLTTTDVARRIEALWKS